MKSSLVALVLSLAACSRAGEVVLSATDGAVAYGPTPGSGSWTPITAPGALNGGQGAFLLGQTDQGRIQITPKQAFTGFQFWGWPRSDGCLYEIVIDSDPAQKVDCYDPKSDGSAIPALQFRRSGLKNAVHTVILKNLNDTRTPRGFGQMNFDHAVLITDDRNPNPPTSSPPGSTTTTTTTNPPTPTSTPPPTTSSTPNLPTTPVVIRPTGSPPAAQSSLGPEQNPPEGALALRGAPFGALVVGVAAWLVL